MSRPAGSRRFSAGSRIALAVAVGVLVLPGAAAAGPVEDVAQSTAQVTEPVGQVVDRTSAAVPDIRQTVEQSVARVTPAVKAVTGAEPIRSTVQAVTASVDRAAPGTGTAVATVAGRLEQGSPTAASPIRPSTERRDVGAIDRQASRRSGRAHGGPSEASGATSAPATPQTFIAATTASTEQARSAASSASAAGDDGGLDFGQPPFGIGGGDSLLGGPAGIALLALGLLAGLLMLVPRFSTRLLHMSPARWGPVAFHVPIERPG